MPVSSRPQTLKQAKRAYRKSSANVRPSASEIAQAERRAALQERADRIRDREARRKANIKKKEEKIAKEKETAKRMGRPFAEDKKPTWKIGPSQLDLGGFLDGAQQTPDMAQESHDQEDTKAPALAEDKAGTCTSPSSQRLTKANAQDHRGLPLNNLSPNLSAVRMPPPPPRPVPKPASFEKEALDDWFPSNTQIERELSPFHKPVNIPPTAVLQPRVSSRTPDAPICKTETAPDLLACIMTQDLDLSQDLTQPPREKVKDQQDVDILAQICTQDLNSDDDDNELSCPASKSGQTESDAALAQISTQDVELLVETELDSSQNSQRWWDDWVLQNLANATQLSNG